MLLCQQSIRGKNEEFITSFNIIFCMQLNGKLKFYPANALQHSGLEARGKMIGRRSTSFGVAYHYRVVFRNLIKPSYLKNVILR